MLKTYINYYNYLTVDSNEFMIKIKKPYMKGPFPLVVGLHFIKQMKAVAMWLEGNAVAEFRNL